MHHLEVVLEGDEHDGFFILFVGTPAFLLEVEQGVIIELGQAVHADVVVLEVELGAGDQEGYFHSCRAHDWHPLTETFFNDRRWTSFISVEADSIESQEYVLRSEILNRFLLAKASLLPDAALEQEIDQASFIRIV